MNFGKRHNSIHNKRNQNVVLRQDIHLGNEKPHKAASAKGQIWTLGSEGILPRDGIGEEAL